MNDGKTTRWSQTCPRGHFHRERAEVRPVICPVCGERFPTPGKAVGKVRPETGLKKPSGSAALFTRGG
jgi:hypothetical protein